MRNFGKRNFVIIAYLAFIAQLSIAQPLLAADKQEIWLDRLTWTQLAQAIKKGDDAVLIPSGGTEANGPYIALGKHNYLIAQTAEIIARKAGHMHVAPVIPYAPEGEVENTGLMQFAGTISLQPDTFAKMLEDTARSLKHHGFREIYFLAEHGGSIAPQEAVAARLNREWKGQGVRVASVGDYYNRNGQNEWVAAHHPQTIDPQAHAGFADTSEMLACCPQLLRAHAAEPYDAKSAEKSGVFGDASGATAASGKALIALKIDAALKQIEQARSTQTNVNH